MATKSFAIRTEPHEALIGDVRLLFVSEVIGAVFAQAYAELRDVQKAVNDAQSAKDGSFDPAVLTELHEAMRSFVRTFLTPESHSAFNSMQLPDRVLVQLIEWTGELYGGASGNDRTGQSSESS